MEFTRIDENSPMWVGGDETVEAILIEQSPEKGRWRCHVGLKDTEITTGIICMDELHVGIDRSRAAEITIGLAARIRELRA